MARAVGLMNPKNAVKSGGGFKEGNVRIDSNSYKVHKGTVGEGQPDAVAATKWSWMITRLQEDGITPLLDEHDEEVHEELLFSFGGTCITAVHPGHASSAQDEEPEDLGTELGTEGNTIYVVAENWKPNEKSGLSVLTNSLSKQQIKDEFLDRCWAPDWNGCIFHMKTQEGGKGGDGRVFTYKVVSKILRGPGSASGGSKKKGVNGPVVVADPTSILVPIVTRLSADHAGEKLTRINFTNYVKKACAAANIPSEMLVPVLKLVKDDKWLSEYADTLGYSLSGESIVFEGGNPAA